MSDRLHRAGRVITARRFSSNAEADLHDAEFWRKIPTADRVQMVWQLSVDQWRVLGRDPDKPGRRP